MAASVAWCQLCKRNVAPKKKFNWRVFIFLCGIFYIPYYLRIKKPECSICGSEHLGVARAQETDIPETTQTPEQS